MKKIFLFTKMMKKSYFYTKPYQPGPDKVLEQNSIYSKKEIDNIIRDLTGFIPITIEKNKCDVANYPSFPFLKDDIDFINHLDEELKSVSIKRITLFDRPIDEVAICG